MIKLKYYFLILLLMFGVFAFAAHYKHLHTLPSMVYAEDDEAEDRDKEEEEHEDEDRDEYEDHSSETTPVESTVPEETVQYEEVQVVPAPQVTYVWVYDSGYDTDTDKDGLVDAIDPDPNVDQRLFFTDTDSDGVADALDKYAGENDFYMSDDTDDNGNGVVDSIE